MALHTWYNALGENVSRTPLRLCKSESTTFNKTYPYKLQ